MGARNGCEHGFCFGFRVRDRGLGSTGAFALLPGKACWQRLACGFFEGLRRLAKSRSLRVRKNRDDEVGRD